jgi:hypothetical protein
VREKRWEKNGIVGTLKTVVPLYYDDDDDDDDNAL